MPRRGKSTIPVKNTDCASARSVFLFSPPNTAAPVTAQRFSSILKTSFLVDLYSVSQESCNVKSIFSSFLLKQIDKTKDLG